MIDISSMKWEFSKDTQYAVNWLNKNGFDGKLEKQYVSKDVFTVTKDSVTDRFEVPCNVSKFNVSKHMEQFKSNWELLCELQRMRKELKEKGIKDGR